MKRVEEIGLLKAYMASFILVNQIYLQRHMKKRNTKKGVGYAT